MNLLKRIKVFFLYHSRKYDAVLKETNFKFSRDIEKIDAVAVRYQAYSSFYTENYYHSKACFELLVEKKVATAKDCDFLAVVYARQNEKERAISSYCMALEISKNDGIAKKSLDYIRKNAKTLNLMEDGYFESLLPKGAFYIPIKQFFIAIAILFLISILAFFMYKGYQHIASNYVNKSQLEKSLDQVALPNYNPNILESGKDPSKSYSYSESEIKALFDRIRANILAESYVEAQININRVKMSNANGNVKTRVAIFEDFIKEPDYATFKNVIDFQTFQKEPKLYNNIYILWNGKVVNRIESKSDVKFDFVIADEERGTIYGILLAAFKKAIIVNNNEKIGLFGKIAFDPNDNNKYYIDGLYIIKAK